MKKHIFIKISILCILLIIIVINAVKIGFEKTISISVSSESDLSFESELENADIDEVQSQIDSVKEVNALKEAEILKRKKRTESVDNVKEQLANGDITFNGIFKDTIIVGDSLMKAISAYNVLGEDIVIGQVSATLYHLGENIDRIIAAQPSILVIHYGENHLGLATQAAIDKFIEYYKDLILKLEAGLPDTKIVISNIFTASDEGIRKQSFLANVPLYNEALKNMCDEMDLYYFDNSKLLPGDNHYYGSDGIHVSGAFYREQWLPQLIYELGL